MAKPDLSKLSALVLDDNAHMIHIVRSMLLGFGINRTFESRDAAEAFDLTQTELIDVIIADLQMPILDGLEFTQLVRTGQDSRNPFVPIILLTAHTERSRIFAARDIGVTEICAKPINAKQLYQKLAAVINSPRPFVRAKSYFGPDRRRRELDPPKVERRKSEDSLNVENGESGDETAAQPA